MIAGIFDTELGTPANWLEHGIQGQSKTIRPLWQKYEDENISKILGLPSGRQKQHWRESCTLFDTCVCNHHTGNGLITGSLGAAAGYHWCMSECDQNV